MSFQGVVCRKIVAGWGLVQRRQWSLFWAGTGLWASESSEGSAEADAVATGSTHHVALTSAAVVSTSRWSLTEFYLKGWAGSISWLVCLGLPPNTVGIQPLYRAMGLFTAWNPGGCKVVDECPASVLWKRQLGGSSLRLLLDRARVAHGTCSHPPVAFPPCFPPSASGSPLTLSIHPLHPPTQFLHPEEVKLSYIPTLGLLLFFFS